MHHTESFPPVGVACVNLFSLHRVPSELTEFVLCRNSLLRAFRRNTPEVPFEDIVRLDTFPRKGIAPPPLSLLMGTHAYLVPAAQARFSPLGMVFCYIY